MASAATSCMIPPKGTPCLYSNQCVPVTRTAAFDSYTDMHMLQWLRKRRSHVTWLGSSHRKRWTRGWSRLNRSSRRSFGSILSISATVGRLVVSFTPLLSGNLSPCKQMQINCPKVIDGLRLSCPRMDVPDAVHSRWRPGHILSHWPWVVNFAACIPSWLGCQSASYEDHVCSPLLIVISM